MTDASSPTGRFAAGEFRVGRVLNRTLLVFGRNLLPFSLVTAVASLPNLLFPSVRPGSVVIVPWMATASGLAFLAVALTLMLYALTQAIVLYAAFQDMRGRPVDLLESTKIGLRRALPVLGVFVGVAILTLLISIAATIPAIVLTSNGARALGVIAAPILLLFGLALAITMWCVAIPACVVERLGPWRSMRRSMALTRGHRWKIFGLLLLLAAAGLILSGVVVALSSFAGSIMSAAVGIVWGALWGAFLAILVVVTYHDLRVAKEGLDTDQIAAVFD